MRSNKQFHIEIITRYICKKCKFSMDVSNNYHTIDECPPDKCPACATGDIHIARTPLRRAVDNIGMRCW